jgi:hypothetical protein
MIRRLFTTDFTINRQSWSIVDGVDRSAELAVGSFSGYRQQVSPELTQSLGLTLTLPHTVWCDIDTDVRDGDTLISNNGTDVVRSVQRYGDGLNPHLQLYVEHFGAESDQ